jgi:hypothetical protein
MIAYASRSSAQTTAALQAVRTDSLDPSLPVDLTGSGPIDSEGASTDGVRQAVAALSTCPVQEGVHCCWIEVEHLGPCQPPVPDFVQAQDRAVEPLALRP